MIRNRYDFDEMRLPAYTGQGAVSDCWNHIPEQLITEMRLWIENGYINQQSELLPFLLGHRDDESLRRFFMIYAPRHCWGGLDRVMNWKYRRGLKWPPVK